MGIWNGEAIARAFKLKHRGQSQDGLLCFETPLGGAVPAIYRGDLEYLAWLGNALPRLNRKLEKLSLSCLLAASIGTYHAIIGGEPVVLSTYHGGPSCDPCNAFELNTIAAGLAHIHSIEPPIFGESNPLSYYRGQREALIEIIPGQMTKPVMAAWYHLRENLLLCMEEAMEMLSSNKSFTKNCLTLGAKGFSNFVYLAENHLVHYNSVVASHPGMPAQELARLLSSPGIGPRLAYDFLTSYQRVRPLTETEGREMLAYLWFPREAELDLLLEVQNVEALEQAVYALQVRIGLIAEIEEMLPRDNKPLPPEGRQDATAEEIAWRDVAPTDIHDAGSTALTVPLGKGSEPVVSEVDPPIHDNATTVSSLPNGDNNCLQSSDVRQTSSTVGHVTVRPQVTWQPFPRTPVLSAKNEVPSEKGE